MATRSPMPPIWERRNPSQPFNSLGTVAIPRLEERRGGYPPIDTWQWARVDEERLGRMRWCVIVPLAFRTGRDATVFVGLSAG